MNRAFYHGLCAVGRGPVLIASRRVVRGREHLKNAGGCLLAVNHRSVYDCMLVMGATWRVVRWVSAVEVSLGPWRRFFKLLGVVPLVRSGRDARAAREIVRLLRAGEVVGIFPEGRLRTGPDAVTAGGPISDSVCRLAELAGAPIVPCAAAGGEKFGRWTAWLPLRRTRWAVHFGEPLWPGPDFSGRLRRAMMDLYRAAAEDAGETA